MWPHSVGVGVRGGAAGAQMGWIGHARGRQGRRGCPWGGFPSGRVPGPPVSESKAPPVHIFFRFSGGVAPSGSPRPRPSRPATATSPNPPPGWPWIRRQARSTGATPASAGSSGPIWTAPGWRIWSPAACGSPWVWRWIRPPTGSTGRLGRRPHPARPASTGRLRSLITTGLQSPQGLALDPLSGYLYWADFGTDKIQRVPPDGSGEEDVITENLDTPYGLAVGAGLPARRALPRPGGRPLELLAVSGDETWA